MSGVLKTLKPLKRSTRAVAMTEFALAMPLVLTASLGGLEIANYVAATTKINQISAQLADNIGRIGDTSTLQDRKLFENDLNDVLLGADMQGGDALDLYQHGRVIVSSLEIFKNSIHCKKRDCSTLIIEENKHFISWQRCLGLKKFDSSYGKQNSAIDGGIGPADAKVFAEPSGATIFVEVVYDYQPLFTDSIVSNPEIRSIASFVVRHNRDRTEIYKRNDYGTPAESGCNVYTNSPAT